MSELIDNVLIDRKYDISINTRGKWLEGDVWKERYGYSLKLLGVTLNSSKSYKRYEGAKKAARNFVYKLDNKGG